MRAWLAWLPLLGGLALRAAPMNVALHRSYTLSPSPSYRFCTDSEDKKQLTDGVYSQGYFWTQRSTVGWNHASPVIITIDLGRVEPLCGVSWNCAAGVAGVTWPECLYVLASEDGRTWTYLGDLCELGTVDKVVPDKGYALFRFATERMKGRGRYVCVIAAAQPFCFVDEIEILRGDDAWLRETPPRPSATDPRQFYERRCVHSGVAARLRADLQSAVKQSAQCSNAVGVRAEALKGRISGFAEGVAETVKTILPYGELHESILALNAFALRASGVTQTLVWQDNRWSPLGLTVIPPKGAGVECVSLDLMRGEVRSEAFNITNPSEEPLAVDVSLGGIPATAQAELREVLVTDTKSRTPVAAALRRIEPDAKGRRWVRIPGGCTRQVWVMCRRPKGEAKTHEGHVLLDSGDGRFTREVPLRIKVRNLDFPKQPALHVGGWDYVQGRADYYKAPGNVDANVALMREMYVDSPWATSAVFPKGAAFDAGGRLTNEEALDFSCWDAWLARWQGARNYCVFFSVGKAFNGEKMGSERFNAMVGSWLAAWVRHLKRQGLKPEQLVVHLVDEPHEREQDAVIVSWAGAIKAAKLGVTLFVDPTYADPTKGEPDMFKACDVLCPNTPMMLAQGDEFRAFYLAQKAAGKTLWLYSCSGPAKQLDPITYHRAQAWLAFQLGAQGTFFWAFGCGGGIGDSWRAYAQAHVEYSPYFVGPADVLEGKHSEAVREGVQDYEYLLMLRNKVERFKAAREHQGWVLQSESLLKEGVADALKTVASSNLFWAVSKDRSAMDALRIRVLDALELAPGH